MISDFASISGKLFDSVVRLVPADRWHEQADGGGTTLAGLLLHVARHQDLAVNVVIRNHEPIFLEHREALGLQDAGVGVGLAEHENSQATALISPESVLHYATAVFHATADWLSPLGSLVLDIEPNTSYRLANRGGLDPDEYPWLCSLWAGKELWWFVPWPVLGHGHAHVGEAISIRNRFGLSPF